MAQTTETVTMKTLPMKYKAMQYALASFISKQSSFDEAVKTTLYKELMLFAPVAEQVSFFEAEYDLKNIEKNIVKPIIKAQKDAEKKANAPVKEKKPRAPRKKEETGKKESEPKQAKPKTKSKKEPEPAPKVDSCCGKECYTSADDDHEILRCQDSGVPKEDCMNHTDTETKSETTETEKEEKKEEALTDEMEAEPYVEMPNTPVAAPAAAKPKKEKKEKKVKEENKTDKNEKKKVTKKSKPADDENKTPKMPNARMVIKNSDEKFLLFQNDKRYWCTDAHFKNGTIYEDTADEDGDSAPGREIGTIENGVLMIHHDV
jgi:DNA mismatch repair ATPase MutL